MNKQTCVDHVSYLQAVLALTTESTGFLCLITIYIHCFFQCYGGQLGPTVSESAATVPVSSSFLLQSLYFVAKLSIA